MSRPETAAGLYVHLPFCSAVCPYCDFAVLTARPARRSGVIARLVEEARLRSSHGNDLPAFDTIYLGGGTPSIHPPEELALLLDGLRRELPIRPEAALFLEANPEDADAARLRAWRELGVEFLSLGVQSFQAASLRFLGRRHGPAQAMRAVEEALAEEIATVSVDLIFGLPRQGAGELEADLEILSALAPPHVSCYQLTVHPGTHFHRRREEGRLRELPEEAQGELFLRLHEVLGAAGWQAYEVSNFARSPAHRSRHNRKYWSHAPYLGLGPSAHSFDGGRRWWNLSGLADWSQAVDEGRLPIAGSEELGDRDLALEALMLGLRTLAGIDLERWRERFGTDLLAANADAVDRMVHEGLLAEAAGRLRPTPRGLAVADALAGALTTGLEPGLPAS